MSQYLDLDALWRVAVLSTAFCVGVVGLYSLGVIALDTPAGGAQPGRARRGLGYACFGACLIVIAVGIWVMLDK